MRYIFLLALIGIKSLCAQSISGKIVTNDDKQPAAFATVLIEGKGFGTAADEDGNFALNIPPQYKNETLSISFLGYSKKTIPINKLYQNQELIIHLIKDAATLSQFTVVARKDYKPKELLRKVLKKIEVNYAQDTLHFDGYYRETLTENGKYIKYADAACKFYYAPYVNRKYKKKEYSSPYETPNTMSDLPIWWGARLHRGHFWFQTLKTDQVKIIESRSSNNLTSRNLNANIEGGPLGLLAKDRVKFQQYFLNKKHFSKFNYSLQEELDTINKEWNYVIYFSPKSANDTPKEGKKNWKTRKIFGVNNQEGKIIINRNSFAIKSMEYSVSKNLKKYICGYTTNAIKHFDYQIKADYSLINNTYYLTHLKQQDEFIFKDTIENTTTPYNASLELFITNISEKKVKPFKKEEVFVNTDANQLFDYPLYYNDTFWTIFSEKHPAYTIPKVVRVDMERTTKLEKQFADKHRRDTTLKAPIANIEPYKYTIHKEEVTDNYAWLKDVIKPIQNKKVMDYIYAENKYFDNYFIPLRKSQRNIFNQLKMYEEKNYKSLPIKRNGYFYYLKYLGENEYPTYYRKKVATKKEEVLLDVEEMAKDQQYYWAGGITVSPNNTVMAYYENTKGNDNYRVKFKNLSSNKMLKDSIENPGEIVWLNDSTIVYSLLEKKTNRANQILKHHLLSSQMNDQVIKFEKDVRFGLSVRESKSKNFIYISSTSSNTSEQYYIRINSKNQLPKLFYPREENHQYSVTDANDKFYILTNKKALNGRIVYTDTSDFSINKWKELVPHNKNVLISNFEVFNKYIVINEKENAQPRLRVLNLATNKSHIIKFKEDYYNVSIGYNPDFNTDTLQFNFSSFITPQTVYNYNMKTEEKRIVKQRKWLNAKYNPYVVKRIWATAKDGKKIPITLFYRKWISNNKVNPEKNKLLLTSYGSYGAGQNINFSTSIYPLIERGFIYAVAHIRGGNDMGQQWYLDGKKLNKINTFTDFIACAEYLVQKEYVDSGNITIEGGSAGGLLMGAVANMRPELFKAVILDVPFVDVVNTMLDEKLPLTTGEYEEWGNPNVKKYFNYIKSYSPYDNVKKQDYPPMFFFTGLNDSRVGYWEPAKMVAKLRQYKTDKNILLLKTNIYAGHGGNSGRYSAYKDLAMKYALIFDLYKNSTSNEH